MHKKIFLFLFFITISSITGQGKDTLYISHGIKISGSLISVSRSEVKFIPFYSKRSVTIVRKEVLGIFTKKVFEIAGEDFKKIGMIKNDPNGNGKIYVLTATGRKIYLNSFKEIISMKDLPREFEDNFTGRTTFGYIITSANDQTQFTFDSNLNYFAEFWSLTGSYNYLFADAKENTQKRTEFDSRFNQTVNKKLFATLGFNMFNSDVQKIDLRTNTSLGLGLTFLNSKSTKFSSSVGGNWNTETYTDASLQPEKSLEAYGELKYHYSGEERWRFNIGSALTKSFVREKRVRIKLNAEVSFNLLENIPINLSLILKNHFDSHPAPGAQKNDYVFQTNIGYSF